MTTSEYSIAVSEKQYYNPAKVPAYSQYNLYKLMKIKKQQFIKVLLTHVMKKKSAPIS